MSYFEVLIEERFFTVAADYRFEEYRTQATAIASPSWSWIIILQKGNSPTVDAKKNIYNFEFINRGDQQCCKEIRIGQWTAILDWINQGSELKYLQAHFKYASPSGVLRSLRLGYPKFIDSVIINIQKLQELAKFTSWTEFDLQEENAQLKKEIELLKLQVTELEEKVKVSCAS